MQLQMSQLLTVPVYKPIEPLIKFLEKRINPPRLFRRPVYPQHGRTQGRRQRQRDESGNSDGNSDS